MCTVLGHRLHPSIATGGRARASGRAPGSGFAGRATGRSAPGSTGSEFLPRGQGLTQDARGTGRRV